MPHQNILSLGSRWHSMEIMLCVAEQREAANVLPHRERWWFASMLSLTVRSGNYKLSLFGRHLCLLALEKQEYILESHFQATSSMQAPVPGHPLPAGCLLLRSPPISQKTQPGSICHARAGSLQCKAEATCLCGDSNGKKHAPITVCVNSCLASSSVNP